MTWTPFRRRTHKAQAPTTAVEPEHVGFVVRTGSTIGARVVNQDRALLAGPVIAIADGVGGSVRGDVAAQVALGRIAIDSALLDPVDAPSAAVKALVEAAHREARNAANALGAVETSSTLALLHVSRPANALVGDVLLTIAWVGDSPVLVADRHGVEQVTVAHTHAPDGHAGRGFALMRAVGGIDASPDLVTRLVQPPCRVILASDGILDLPREVIDAVLTDFDIDPGRCVEELLGLTADINVNDNTTIAVVDLVHTSQRTTLTCVL